jgi:bacterioferritin (cytochrome b1)
MSTPTYAFLDQVVAHSNVHSRWLNSLSYLENTGARLIARYQDPVATDLILLKHAAEEFRHAYYLKKMIDRVEPGACPDYSMDTLLAANETRLYLLQLNLEVSRMLKHEGIGDPQKIKKGAYLLVTYAIEVRADALYGAYQASLTKSSSRVNVKSIIAEEEGHLAEMQQLLQDYDTGSPRWAEMACAMETRLHHNWLDKVRTSIAEKISKSDAGINTTF